MAVRRKEKHRKLQSKRYFETISRRCGVVEARMLVRLNASDDPSDKGGFKGPKLPLKRIRLQDSKGKTKKRRDVHSHTLEMAETTDDRPAERSSYCSDVSLSPAMAFCQIRVGILVNRPTRENNRRFSSQDQVNSLLIDAVLLADV